MIGITDKSEVTSRYQKKKNYSVIIKGEKQYEKV